jgi:tetratricopeptide (TPR) repeat protein
MDRFRTPAIVLAAALAVACTGWISTPAGAEPGSWIEPPAKVPKRKPFSEDLEFLFGALKVAPDENSAKAIEQRIWAQWMVSPSDTANLLMVRVRTAIEAKDTDLAIRLLDGIVRIRPDYVEGWNRRATLYYMKKDYGRSLADIREVLRREPRHFGALAGLGLILQDIGDDKRALDAYRRALDVYPRLQRIPDVVKKLQEEVEGRDI